MRIEAHCTTAPEALASAILKGTAVEQAAVLELLAHGWAAEIERGTGRGPAVGLCDPASSERQSVTGARATAARLRVIAAEIEEHADWCQIGTDPAPVSPEILATLEAAKRAFGEIEAMRCGETPALHIADARALARSQRDRVRATIMKATTR
jgi:hypothetical protein